MSRKHMVLGMSILLIALIVVACGSSASSSSSTTPTTAPTSSTPTVKILRVTISGKSQVILTNAQGMTLYYFRPDSATKANCTGTCEGIWPPLIFTGSGSPTLVPGVPGNLSVVTDANGRQVEYNGHPLYTYSKDTAPGQTLGEGIKGEWFVATPNLPVQSAATPSGY